MLVVSELGWAPGVFCSETCRKGVRECTVHWVLCKLHNSNHCLFPELQGLGKVSERGKLLFENKWCFYMQRGAIIAVQDNVTLSLCSVSASTQIRTVEEQCIICLVKGAGETESPFQVIHLAHSGQGLLWVGDGVCLSLSVSPSHTSLHSKVSFSVICTSSLARHYLLENPELLKAYSSVIPP